MKLVFIKTQFYKKLTHSVKCFDSIGVFVRMISKPYQQSVYTIYVRDILLQVQYIVHAISRLLFVNDKKGKVHPCTGSEALYRPYCL